MSNAARLDALAPRPQNAFVRDVALRGAAQPAVAELQALASVDFALLRDEMDHEALEASARLLDARSHSDDLRLPPPPRRSKNGAQLYRSVADGVARYRDRRSQPVSVEPQAIDAEHKLMAACQGICRFQDQIFGARERPVGAIEQRVRGRRS